MENLQKVLAAVNGSLTDIVELTRYMVDQASNQDGVNRAMARYFGDHRPSRGQRDPNASEGRPLAFLQRV